jgi:cytochrome o ubiquinol oxidase subunit II
MPKRPSRWALGESAGFEHLGAEAIRFIALTISSSSSRAAEYAAILYSVSPPLGGLGRAWHFRRISRHVQPRQWMPMECVMQASPDRISPEVPRTIGAFAMRLRAISMMSAAMLLASCNEGVLDPHGPVGRAERVILYDSTAIMLAVIIPVIVLTLVFAWWFRARNSRARYRPDWEYSGRIEMIVWCIPALIILFLGGIAWTGSHDLDPPAPLEASTPPIDIEVISLDWRWLFIYPHEGISSLNRLVVPAGVPLRFRLTSTTVMNSFFVPQLGSQIYAMPNMVTRLNLKADQPGTFAGLSAQFSGDGFSDMRFDLVAMEPDVFERWVTTTKTRGGVLDESTFAELVKPAKAEGAQTYAQVSDGIFDRISSGHMAAVSPQQGQ